ncbi:Ig-like domain-containing protein [Dietzia aerolata]|uniref:Ig-like domain-containing protein n=1 Tax=Dietzia aerolata TaxID=595984 RepID=UPI00362FF022
MLEAGEPGVVEPGIRTDGQAGVFGSDESFVSLLARANAPIIGTVSAPVTCQPRSSATAPLNEGAGPLTTIDVLEPGPVDPGSVITRLEGPGSTDVGQSASFAANVGVAEDEDTIADVDGGSIQFFADGAPIGAPRPVVRGIARLDMTFNVAGTKLVTAEYTDADGNSARVSSPHVLTVVGPEPDPTDPVDPEPSEPANGSLGAIFGSLSAS